MKHLFMMAMLAAASTSLFAQEDAVKEASKLAAKGQMEEALNTITPALTSGTAQNKAEAYNVLSDINYQIFMKQQEIELQNQIKKTTTPYDTVGRANAAYNAVDAALKCDELDNQPNEKGKIKPKYRSSNAKKYFIFRSNLINPGLDYFNKHDYTNAAKFWSMYIDSYSADLFSKEDKTTDKSYTQIAYYGALACYNIKDYARANKYATIALADTSVAKDAMEVMLFSQKESAKTKEDSLAYRDKLNELYTANPKNERVFGLLIDYYSQPGRTDERKAWIEEVIAKDPTNKMAWALKGETAMNEQKYDDAIAAFSKSIEIDPQFVQVEFNIGVCYYSKAAALRESVADKRTGRIAQADATKIESIIKESVSHLEKVRTMDPDREKTNWGYALYQAYYLLGDEAKCKELEPLAR